MKPRILLFIPAFNCEKQIVRVLGQLDDSVMKYISEVIVVNNRSTDGTEEAVINYRKEHWSLPLKLLKNRENYGLGGSHKVAFDYAISNGFDYVIVLHGDDQGDIHDFIPVMQKGIYKGYDCVLGGRFMRGSHLVGYSRLRTFGNIIFDFLYAIGARQRVFDLGAGLNMYSVKMLMDRYYYRFPDNLMFNCCMLLAVHFNNQTARFYPISWREEDQVSNVKLASQAVKELEILFNYIDCPTSIRGEYRDRPVSIYRADEV